MATRASVVSSARCSLPLPIIKHENGLKPSTETCRTVRPLIDVVSEIATEDQADEGQAL